MSNEQRPLPLSPDAISSKATSSTPLPTAWIERIFELMSAYYGKHFADLWGVTDIASVKRVWAEELGRLKPQQIALGMEACKRRKFPPTLPEFLDLCKPTAEQLGIPPLPVAWNEARAIASGQKRREECSHAVVWHAYYEAGPIGHMTERDARDTFKHCYEVAVDMAIRGEPLREIPKALPKPGGETRPPETPEQRKAAADAALARLAEMGINVRDINKPVPEEPTTEEIEQRRQAALRAVEQATGGEASP